jgi:hypothetical protein
MYPTAVENEIIIDNPSVDLINALKVSGRTKRRTGRDSKRENKKDICYN